MAMAEKTEQEEEQTHIAGYGHLLAVISGLLLLTITTVAISYVNLGYFNVPIALMIASIKSTLVLMFFMHLKNEGKVIKISFLSTIAFLFIMISFIFWDVAYR